MINLVKVLTCTTLVSLLSGSLVACGVTSEVVTTHPSSSSTIGPVSSTIPASEVAEEGGRPRARRTATNGATTREPARPAASAAVVVPAARTAAPVVARPATTFADMHNMRTQSGRIIDEAGQPLVGATVLLKGTRFGASTDANGDYSLSVPLGINTFVFAYTGYTDEVAQSRDGQPLTVTLLPVAGQASVVSEPTTKTRQPKVHQRKSQR